MQPRSVTSDVGIDEECEEVEITFVTDDHEDNCSCRACSTVNDLLKSFEDEEKLDWPSMDSETADEEGTITDLDGEILISTATIEREQSEFFQQEEDLDFYVRMGVKRIPCFSHTLQLVVTAFDKKRNGTGCKHIGAAIKSAKSLCASFNKSTVATPKLISRAGKKLLSDVAVRWSSTFLLIERLVELKIHVNAVCHESNWDSLSNTQWAICEKIVELLRPFAVYTQLISGDKVVTISSVAPAIMELELHLEKV